MQLPVEIIMKCVAFLGCRRNSGVAINATVFFAGWPLPIRGREFFIGYAITAKHVIEQIKKRTIDGNSYFRINTKEHKAEHFALPLSHWLSDPDPQVDVAVAELPPEFFGSRDHLPLPVEMFADDEVIRKKQIDVGNDLFFPGLFAHVAGQTRNTPILRAGNIAAMPQEPIQTCSRVLRPSYLVEARSVGGLSGSPVFWYYGPIREMLEGTEKGVPKFHLIGLIHGHYLGRGEQWDSAAPGTIADHVTGDALNAGIAIVTPSQDILHTLQQPELKAQRDEWSERFNKSF